MDHLLFSFKVIISGHFTAGLTDCSEDMQRFLLFLFSLFQIWKNLFGLIVFAFYIAQRRLF